MPIAVEIALGPEGPDDLPCTLGGHAKLGADLAVVGGAPAIASRTLNESQRLGLSTSRLGAVDLLGGGKERDADLACCVAGDGKHDLIAVLRDPKHRVRPKPDDRRAMILAAGLPLYGHKGSPGCRGNGLVRLHGAGRYDAERESQCHYPATG